MRDFVRIQAQADPRCSRAELAGFQGTVRTADQVTSFSLSLLQAG